MPRTMARQRMVNFMWRGMYKLVDKCYLSVMMMIIDEMRRVYITCKG